MNVPQIVLHLAIIVMVGQPQIVTNVSPLQVLLLIKMESVRQILFVLLAVPPAKMESAIYVKTAMPFDGIILAF